MIPFPVIPKDGSYLSSYGGEKEKVILKEFDHDLQTTQNFASLDEIWISPKSIASKWMR
jgi:hypothetical protein